uniref:OTU domain-containing protein n=1 Tax=Arcella intermedia TaxID=1963864 RepID=A0A6B2LP84_9EUKA
MMERLKLYGLKLKTRISGDGNCQFASVADQLFNDPSRHHEIRKKAVAWLRKNKTYKLPNDTTLQDYLQTEFFPTWPDYCDYMDQEGIWGDHLTLVAVAEAYALKIVVISSMEVEPGIDPFTVIVARAWAEEDRTIYVAHLHEIHYSSICEDEE